MPLLLMLLCLLPLHGWAGQATPVMHGQADAMVTSLAGGMPDSGACTLSDAQGAALATSVAGVAAAASAASQDDGQLLVVAEVPFDVPPTPLFDDGGEPSPTGADLAEQLLPSRAPAVIAQAARATPPPYAGAALPDPLLPRLPRPPRA
ncbi:hypothetical protein [Paracidovorax citrulli]